MLYFKGCTAREKMTSLCDSTEEILKKADIDYRTIENEECCGSVLLRTGFKDESIAQMKANLNNIKSNLKNDNEEIIVSCAGCYKTLKTDYKDILDVDLNVIHISQLLDNLFNNNIIKIDRTVNINTNDTINTNNNGNINNGFIVTYHDSCHLARHAGEYEAPRNIINSVANNTNSFVEMENNKEEARCCGSGGGVKSAHNIISNNIAKKRIEEAEKNGASLLITTCPFCKLNLSENIDSDSNLEVLDLTEFVVKFIK